MKKLMTVFLAAALVFAVAGQASAAALETKGEFRARYWWLDNYFVNKKNTEFFDSRLRLYMTWPIADTVKVFARADLLEGFWGDNTTNGTSIKDDPATPGLDANVVTNFGTTPKLQVDFDWLYSEFVIGGTTVQAGRMDVSWGTGMYAKSDNRYRLRFARKFGNVSTAIALDRTTETLHGAIDGQERDDANAVSLGAAMDVAGLRMGLLGVYSQNKATVGLEATRIGLDYFAMGALGPVKLNAEIAGLVDGKDDYEAAGKDIDVTGLMAYLGLSMNLGPVNCGAEFAYAQGNKPGGTKNEGGLSFDYHSMFSSIILFNNMDYNGYKGESNTATDLSVSNAWAGKLSASMELMKGFNLTLAGVYAARLEDTVAHKADPLGTEFDLVASYAVNENVSIVAGVGYLSVGDYYGDVENPMGVMVGSFVKF